MDSPSFLLTAPVFDDVMNPRELEFIITLDFDGNTSFHKLKDLPDTPYYYLGISDIDYIDVLTSKSKFVLDKSNLYKFVKGLDHVPDYHFSLWSTYVKLDEIENKKLEIEYLKFHHLNEYINYIRRLDFSRLTFFEQRYQPYISNHNEVLQFCSSIYGGNVLNEPIKLLPFSKTGRLRDFSSTNSISNVKDIRPIIKKKCKGVPIEIDVDGFHVRLLAKLMDYDIPKNKKALSFLREQYIGSDSIPYDEFKKMVYHSFYSEKFELIDSDFFIRLKDSYKRFDSVLDGTHNFNYKIQQYEIYELSKFVNSIPRYFFYSVKLYIYDGLIFDVKPLYVKDFLKHLKKSFFPFSVKLLDKEYFVY